MGLESVPQCCTCTPTPSQEYTLSRNHGELANRSQTKGWVFTCEWPRDRDDAAAQRAADIMAQNVQELAREKGLLLGFLCMSFASSSQDVLRSYGADNVKRIQDAAAKYDPEGVFQKFQNDGFLLRNLDL